MLNTTTEVPLSKALGAAASMAAHCPGSVFTMCILDGLIAEHKNQSMGPHTWLCVTTLSMLYFTFCLCVSELFLHNHGVIWPVCAYGAATENVKMV